MAAAVRAKSHNQVILQATTVALEDFKGRFGSLSKGNECYNRNFHSFVYAELDDAFAQFSFAVKMRTTKLSALKELAQCVILRLVPVQMYKLAMDNPIKYWEVIDSSCPYIPIETNRYHLAHLFLAIDKMSDAHKSHNKVLLEKKKDAFVRTITNYLLDLGCENFRDLDTLKVGGLKKDGTPRQARTSVNPSMDLIIGKENLDKAGKKNADGRCNFILHLNKKYIQEQWKYEAEESLTITDLGQNDNQKTDSEVFPEISKESTQVAENQSVADFFKNELRKNFPQIDNNTFFKEKEDIKIEKLNDISQSDIGTLNGSNKNDNESSSDCDRPTWKSSAAAPKNEAKLADLLPKLYKKEKKEKGDYQKTISELYFGSLNSVGRCTYLVLNQIISTFFENKEFNQVEYNTAFLDLQEFMLNYRCEMQEKVIANGQDRVIGYSEVYKHFSDHFLPYLIQFSQEKNGLALAKQQKLSLFCAFRLKDDGTWVGGNLTFRSIFYNQFTPYFAKGRKMMKGVIKMSNYNSVKIEAAAMANEIIENVVDGRLKGSLELNTEKTFKKIAKLSSKYALTSDDQVNINAFLKMKFGALKNIKHL